MSAAEITANQRAIAAALAKGDTDAISAMLAPDTAAFPPDGPIVNGREAVMQLWVSAIRDQGVRGARFDTVSVEFRGDIANEIGEGRVMVAGTDGRIEEGRIKYICIWKRIDGKWLLYRDIWNAMPA